MNAVAEALPGLAHVGLDAHGRRKRRSGALLDPLEAKRPITPGRIIDFIEKRCILPESRRPMELHQYQQDLIEEWQDPTTMAHATVIGAGNAKTTTLGAFVTAHLYLVEEASVPIVADTIPQAVLTTWGRVKRFVELNPDLLVRAEVIEGQGSRRGVYVPGMNSHSFAQASKPSGIQGLNPSLAVLEEMSEATVATFAALMNRLGKRDWSKLVGISTPSFMPDNALVNIQRAVRSGQPMPGVKLTEYVSTQKDHRDESGWHMANPGLEFGMPGIAAIRADLAVLPEQQFRAYRLCQQPLGSQSCWLNGLDKATGEELGDAYECWKAGEHGRALVEGAATWVGVDVAKSRDHAAVVWGQMTESGVHAKCKIWTPTQTADIDLDDIAAHLKDLAGRYDVRAVWYDPSYFYNATTIDSAALPMVAIDPTDVRMAPLCGHAYELIRKGLVTHDEDPQFTNHVLAGKRRYCNRGFTIEKRHYQNKCDAAIALVLFLGAVYGPQPDIRNYTLESFKVH